MKEFDIIIKSGEITLIVNGQKKIDIDNGFELIDSFGNQKSLKYLTEHKKIFQYVKLSNSNLLVATDLFQTYDYYFYHNFDKKIFILSSSLFSLCEIMRSESLKINICNEGVKSMISLGYMLAELTYVEGVKRLKKSTVLDFNFMKNSISTLEYNNFIWNPTESDITLNSAINDVDDLMIASFDNISDDNQKDSYSYLSGGLDSRVTTALLCEKQNNQDVTTITFSNSYSSDEIIARQISNKLKTDHIQIPLVDGNFMKNYLDKTIYKNSGMVNLMGGISQLYAVDKINLDSKYIYTGVIGDLVFGSFVNKNAFDLSKHFYFDDFVNTDNFEILNNSCNSDFEYGLNIKTPLAVTNGDKLIRNRAKALSPFYDFDLINHTLKLPYRLMRGEYLYREWMKKRFPEMVNYKWEKSGFKPKYNILTKLGVVSKKYKNGLFNRLNLMHDDMNPFQYWFAKNLVLNNLFISKFELEISKLENDVLKIRLSEVFNSRLKHRMLAYTIVKSINICNGN